MNRELTIARLGNQGDGIAETEDGLIYVPFALPGERITAEIDGNRGALIEILEAAPDRVTPICRHFGICGGCAVQHLDLAIYLQWKRQRITDALSMERIDAPVDPVRGFGPHTRRRATFSALRSGKTLTLGFRRADSHEIADLEECPVLTPQIEAVLPGIRDLLLGILPQGEARILITACNNGLDLNIDADKGKLRPLTPDIGRKAEALGIIRMTHGDDPLLLAATPQVRFADAAVDLPPGAFLQASADAEAAMAEIAIGAIGKAKKVADLYCGLGAFTFALARKSAVTAVELDRRLLASLDAAARRAQGFKPIKTLARNLAREPLSPIELNAFDAVLFDPPRAGALAQARALTKSKVQKVVAVSCNPVSFAKDARTLIDGGFQLTKLTPIDQFVFTPHVEIIAGFSRR
jgi:23S rRNA (uracil1939-C5)-methyltransferase